MSSYSWSLYAADNLKESDWLNLLHPLPTK